MYQLFLDRYGGLAICTAEPVGGLRKFEWDGRCAAALWDDLRQWLGFRYRKRRKRSWNEILPVYDIYVAFLL
jgi:hypothetical protein